MPKLLSADQPKLEAGTLWARAVQQTAHARRVGALVSIGTTAILLTDQGAPFVVRMMTNPPTPRRSPRVPGQASNPFLPYDPDLFVADLSPTHLCLLNKFNVVDNHLLIVTRHFEAQTSWLTLADFAALWQCLYEFEGLAFYNGGTTAGASQPHKHLQYIPLPADAVAHVAPLTALLATALFTDGVGIVPRFPFVHGLVRCDAAIMQLPPVEAALWTLQQYQYLCARLAIQPDGYNLLATRQWLLLVPRTQEQSHGIAVNALGFAGSLLVRTPAELDQLRQIGPLALLRQVARPREASE